MTSKRNQPGFSTRPALWSGLFLGLLLTLFLAAFIYVGYLFLSWGQAAVAEAPKMPPLALPKLVRPATGGETDPGSTTSTGLFQPTGQPVTRETPQPVSGRVTILVMGVDARPDERVSRTDSIMVITVNPKTGMAGMLSLPRDLLVTIPGRQGKFKINSVHVEGELKKVPGGGPALLRSTVAELIGYPVDYYVRMNFDGFRQIIDLIGGVDIDVPRVINDPTYPDEHYGYDPLYIPAGRQHMNGALALKYARTRHGDSDYGRADRQQQILMAIKDKVMQPGQLAALLPKLPGLAVAMANTVQTDMPVEKGISLARVLGQVNLQNPTRIVFDGTMGTETNDPEWGFVLIPDMVKLRAATAAVFADSVIGPTATETARQTLQGESARVVVLNGTLQEGLAAKAQAELAADGIKVVAVGNADRSDYVKTWLIAYGNTTPATREALMRRYGITSDRIRSEPPTTDRDIALIIGAD